jgi:hypothetical protein
MYTEVGVGTATRQLVFVIATAVLIGSPVARAAEEVDLLHVLSSDFSRSIDAQKFKSQRDGYAAAIVNPRVIQATRSGALGKIAVSFVESPRERTRAQLAGRSHLGHRTNPLPRESVARAGCGLDGANHVIERR